MEPRRPRVSPIFGLKQRADDNQEMFSKEAVRTLRRNFYVDDCLKSIKGNGHSNRDLNHRQRNARRRRLQPKEDWVEGFVLRLVALAMAFKNVRNLPLINHNDGFIDDDEFVLLYNLFASKNLNFPYDSYAIDLEELNESESFAEFRFRKRDIRTLKEVLQIPDMITCNQRSVCDGLEGLCMLLKRLSFPCRYGFELVLARQPWFRIPLKEKSF